MGAPSIKTGWKADFPANYARDRQGFLYAINGYNRGLVWDGVSSTAFSLGIKAPSGAPSLADDTGGGSVAASSDYVAAYKYVDLYERESELSTSYEITTSGSANHRFDWTVVSSSETDRVRWIDLYRSTADQEITLYKVTRTANHGTITSSANNGGVVRFTCAGGHGLVTDTRITVSGHSVGGYNTSTFVTVVSTTTFDTTIVYSSNGTGGSFVTTGFQNDGTADATLELNDALPILNSNGTLNARRQGLPPNELSVCAWFQDRMFYAVPRKYSTGTVATTANSITITGTGTSWIEEFGAFGNYYTLGDWYIQIAGEPKPIRIATYNSDTSLFAAEDQRPTLTQPAANYVIYPDPKQYRNRIFYSEVDEGESVAYDQDLAEYVNVIPIQENTGDDDDVTGLMPFSYAMFVLKNRHIYRMQFQKQPDLDAAVLMIASRGCLNQRCWARHEGVAYLMDDRGVYRFNGNDIDPISDAIHDLWRDQTISLVESDTKYYHLAIDPLNEVLRCYVKLSGDTGTMPKRAICYHLRTQNLWLESYPWEIGANAQHTISGQSILLVGSEDENVYKVGFTTQDAGVNIPYTWKSKLFSFVEFDQENDRSISLEYKPTTATASANVRLYFNNESSAAQVISDAKDDNYITWTGGSQAIEVNLKSDADGLQSAPGKVRIPWSGRLSRDSNGDRFMAVEITGSQGASDQIRFHSIEIAGVR